MFKSRSVRVFSGILLGSVAGVGWGAYYHATHAAAFSANGELDKMLDLLACIMFGVGGGFVIGAVIGTARLRWPVVLAALMGVLATFFLPPGMGLFTTGEVETSFLMSGAVVAAVALAVSLALSAFRPKIGPDLFAAQGNEGNSGQAPMS